MSGRDRRPEAALGSTKRSIERGESWITPDATRTRIEVQQLMPAKVEKKLSPAQQVDLPDKLPATPTPPKDFLKHVDGNPHVSVRELLQPYLEHENVLRAYLAQKPDHEFVQDNCVNLLSVFEDGNAEYLKVRARDMENETKEEKDRYIMPLTDKERKKTGELALVQSLDDFRNNFAIFSEGSLANLDWSNVVVAGSAVVTPLLPVPEEHATSKRGLRNYYHEYLAPASDIDLFIYGIEDDAEAVKKMESIERTIKDNLLWETTAIRTRNTVTICSQYPNRHVQIVLRLYKSISQILTGFDVNCSCFAYDGTRVWGNPRALAACLTQCNDIDIRRRSPSYENRLAKYSHKRGFEVYYQELDRNRVDPTVFERSFNRLQGLARLLVLESLPTPDQRDEYQRKRRVEMGRPPKDPFFPSHDHRDKKQGGGTLEVPEWEDFEDVSDYQKFSIPYGEGIQAKRLERMFFKKDLLLNAEWNEKNQPPHREVKLHRHPVFVGDVKDVVGDCCGFCSEPTTEEEIEVAKTEDELYVRGPLKFLHYREADAGRQEVGSFFPLNPDEFCQMAYVGATERLCEAIVNNDIEYIQQWAQQEGCNVNARDYCGRTPLQLACLSNSTDIKVVEILINNGARLIARLQDGRTALHLAAARGRLDMVEALLRRSERNELEKLEREAARLALKKKDEQQLGHLPLEDGGIEMGSIGQSSVAAEASLDEVSASESVDGSSDFQSIRMSDVASMNQEASVTTDHFVKVSKEPEEKNEGESEKNKEDLDAEDEDDIYDINVEDWDWAMTPLHHALLGGHNHVVESLVSNWGADIRKPVKLFEYCGYSHSRHRTPKGAILPLALPLRIEPKERRVEMIRTLLKVGASSGQATITRQTKTTAFHYLVSYASEEVLNAVFDLDGPVARNVMNNVNAESSGLSGCSPLVSAIDHSIARAEYLLEQGARGKTVMQDVLRTLRKASERAALASLYNPEYSFMQTIIQPIGVAVKKKFPAAFIDKLIVAGADPSLIILDSLPWFFGKYSYHSDLPTSADCLLDYVRRQIKVAKKYLEEESSLIEREQKDDKKTRKLFPESVLEKYKPGLYIRYCAENELKRLNYAREAHNDRVAASRALRGSRIKKYALKHQDVEKDLALLKEYEMVLLKHGGKTYHEVYPDKHKEYLEQQEQYRKNEEEARRHREQTGSLIQPYEFSSKTQECDEKEEEFEVYLKFDYPKVSSNEDEQKRLNEGYKSLFSAVWDNDLETIRSLTSGPTGTGKDKIPGLLITAENATMNVLSIALLRGHYHLIEPIMEIVAAQYQKPEEKVVAKKRISDVVDDSDDSDDSGATDLDVDDGSGPRKFTDEEFVVDHTEDSVEEGMPKSHLTPWDFFRMTNWTFIWNPESEQEKEDYKLLESLRDPSSHRRWQWSPLSFAIAKNDLDLFRKLLRIIKNIAVDPVDSEINSVRSYLGLVVSSKGEISNHHVGLATRLGRIDMLEEMMREVSFGIYYEEHEEPDEEERKKHMRKYYQGLSIRGGKKKDWVNGSSPANSSNLSDACIKPVHIAAHAASMASMEWFNSDRPWKLLMEYKAKNQGTKEFRVLTAQGDKLEALLRKGLGLNTNLLPHMVILGWRGKASADMLRHLCSKPGILEARNENGLTPALYAVRGGHHESVKVLVELGADCTARDKNGRNLLHMLLVPWGGYSVGSRAHINRAVKILRYIPRDIVVNCTTQRTMGFMRTPLAHWLHQTEEKYWGILMEVIGPYTTHDELLMNDSEGNTPIHLASIKGWSALGSHFLKLRPTAINMENANGRTPFEIAQSKYLNIIVRGFMYIPGRPNLDDQYFADADLSRWTIQEELDKEKENAKKRVASRTKIISISTSAIRMYKTAMKFSERVVKLEHEDGLKVNPKGRVMSIGIGEGTKRKLVSLTDASELVRKISSNVHKLNADYLDSGDVTTLWDWKEIITDTCNPDNDDYEPIGEDERLKEEGMREVDGKGTVEEMEEDEDEEDVEMYDEDEMTD